MPNDSLSKAKSAKNDEFYTQYGDIEAEMNAYVEFDPGVLRGKTILLPCDDPEFEGYGRRSCRRVEHGRPDPTVQLPDALQDPQPRQRQPLMVISGISRGGLPICVCCKRLRANSQCLPQAAQPVVCLRLQTCG